MKVYQREAEKQRILVKKSDYAQIKLLFIVEALKDLLLETSFTQLLQEERLHTMPRARCPNFWGAAAMTEETQKEIKLAFEAAGVTLNLSQLVPLKTMRPGTKESRKYLQILRSVKAIGLVEAPVVSRDPTSDTQYFLLDGLLRIEALKDLKIDQVECLVATDDETYTSSIDLSQCKNTEWSCEQLSGAFRRSKLPRH